MNKVTLQNPAKLVIGEGSFEQFVTDFSNSGLTRLFIVTIPPVLELVTKQLEELRNKGIDLKINSTILAEPSFEDFERLVEEARSFMADSVAGIGGGSVLDTAKLIAAQLSSRQTTDQVKGIGNLKERSAYLACIPTTAGTGSEVSPNALFIDQTGAKIGVISPHLVPDAAYIDPLLTLSVPPAITASTGIDALTHCLEAYTNRYAHPMVDMFALEGVRLIAQNLLKAYRNGSDKEARAQLALGSMYGGMCLGPVNTAAVHALSYPLGVTYHVPHGVSIALLLPYVMEFNIPSAPERYAQIALALGVEEGATAAETAGRGVAMIRKLIADCALPATLEELNVPASAIPKLAEDAIKVQRLLKNNVREVSVKDAEEIYRAASGNNH